MLTAMKNDHKKFCFTRWFNRSQWIFPIISMIVAFGIWATSSAWPANASFFDLFSGGIQVIQLSNLSDRQEIDLGRQMNQQILQTQFHAINDSVITQYVNRVGQHLVSYSQRPNIPYHFQVVKDKQINAFATTGGYVYVTTALLAAADNEAQLASVLGHEMGHIAARHVIKQMKQQAIESGIVSAVGLNKNTAVNLGVQLALNLPGSRQHEFEADHKGLFTFTKAGYDASAMPAFMQKLVNSSSVPAFLSTHPATPDRIRTLNQLITENHLSNGSLGLGNTNYKAAIRSRLNS
ncbi:MAG: M48 family metallopeptidase [Nostoc sp.]|uniref:M48 family metallopeptidase n=1 Tax=Nostoc sp. TaxID=1180 RepID=UPI002FF4C731